MYYCKRIAPNTRNANSDNIKQICRTNEKMIQTPRSPRPVSLSELVTLGYLAESDVSPGGHVDESRRCRAEQRFLATRPHTAPQTRRVRLTPPQVPPITPQAPLRSRTARGSSAHVHRIHVRRDVQGTDKLPIHVALDTCCICYSNVKDHAVAPCYHMCVCSTCSQRINQCPMCRGPVDRIQRIFV
jgi:hypothetical protein